MKKKWLFAALMLLLLVLALSRFDGWNLLHSLKQIPLWSLALLIGMQIVSQLLVNLQWYKMAKFINLPVSFGDMFYINCQGAVIDSITPGVKFGGEVTRAVQISRKGNCPGETAASVVAMQKLFSLSAFFIINLFAAGFVIGKTSFLQAWYLHLTVYAVLILFLLLFFAVFLMPHRMKIFFQTGKEPRFLWVSRIRNFFITLLDHVISIRKNAGICVLLFLLSLLIWVVYPVKMYLLAVQILPGVDIMYIASVTFVSYMVAMLPVFPGGLGGFEGTMTGLLLTMGFIHSDAFVITVIFRFITFWFVLLFSIVYAAVYKVGFMLKDSA